MLYIFGGKTFLHSFPGEKNLGLPIKPHQGARLAFSQVPLPEQLLHLFLQTQKPEFVGHRCLGSAKPFRQGTLTLSSVLQNLRQRGGLLHRREVLTLNILHQRHNVLLTVIRLKQHHRHGLHSRKLAGPQTPLSGYQLVLSIYRTHRQRLEKAHRTDRVGQLFQSLFVEVFSGLSRIRSNLSEGKRKKRVFLLSVGGLGYFQALFGILEFFRRSLLREKLRFAGRGVVFSAALFPCEIPYHVHDRPPS
jgi:hypothetical protein